MCHFDVIHYYQCVSCLSGPVPLHTCTGMHHVSHYVWYDAYVCVCVCCKHMSLLSSLSLFLAAFVVSDIVWLTSHGCHNFHNIASPYYCMLILAHSAPFWPSWCLSPLKITYFYYLICDEILAGETGSCLPLMKHTLTCTHCGHIGTTWDT